MNVLLLVFSNFLSLKEKNAGIYADLVREFVNDGHTVYRLYLVDKVENKAEQVYKEPGQVVVKTTVGKIRGNSNLISKGIETVLLEPRIKTTVKKYFSDVHFDLVLFATPPITFYSAVRYVKKRDHALCYLMLKDIFPQGALDLQMLSETGLKGFIYRAFRRKEKKLYGVADYIGCMSPANIAYLLKHNDYVPKDKVELLPNSIVPVKNTCTESEKTQTRQQFHIPDDSIVFAYGGNLGKPQGIPFIIDLLKEVGQRRTTNADVGRAQFVIAGEGSEYGKLQEYCMADQPEFVKLIPRMKQEVYDSLLASSDIGLVFLDNRFTIPNFPSRILNYMQSQMPVLCFTDPNTDIGSLAEEGGFGWNGRSDDVQKAADLVCRICSSFNDASFVQMRQKSWDYFVENYDVAKAYSTIAKHFMS